MVWVFGFGVSFVLAFDNVLLIVVGARYMWVLMVVMGGLSLFGF